MRMFYDFFISYSNYDLNIARNIVDKIEKQGKKCFIAPRDIVSGSDYATQIVKAISNSLCVLLIFSLESNKSSFVLREVNSAVTRNKVIIPLKVDDSIPSEAMEFYLGTTHWLNAFPEVLDSHIFSIIEIAKNIKLPETYTDYSNSTNLQAFDTKELLDNGFDKKMLVMKAIELDYLCISAAKLEVNDQLEGTFDDWIDSITANSDASAFLLQDDKIIGYCEAYPVEKDEFRKITAGGDITSSSQIALYRFGGIYDLFISMVAVEPSKANQESILLLFNKIHNKIKCWHQKEIYIEKIGISVYSTLLEKFVKKFGFELVGLNHSKGKIYVTTLKNLLANEFFKKTNF